MSDFEVTGEWFDVSDSADSVTAARSLESANVCRVAALSTMLGAPPTFTREVAPALAELGFSPELANGERDYRRTSPFADDTNRPLSPSAQPDEARAPRWQTLNETGRPGDLLAFIVAVLGSGLERESAAAAATLWRDVLLRITAGPRAAPDWWWRYELLFDWLDDVLFDLDLRPFPQLFSDDVDPDDPDAGQWVEWDPEQWQAIFARVTDALRGSRYDDPYLIGVLVRWRLGRALRSPDPIVRQLAFAAFPPSDSDDEQPPPIPPRSTPPGALVVSTMIHGTWGWKGDWWRPRSPFHEFILRSHRPNLFSRGARFSWSGAYSDRQRALAACDLIDWSYDAAPHGVQTLFAHSYGGEVAARAIASGANVHELVLLSSPATSHVRQIAASTTRVVDVRLKLDPVLSLARVRQRIPQHPNVTPVIFSRWNLDHGATHNEQAWQHENVPQRGQL